MYAMPLTEELMRAAVLGGGVLGGGGGGSLAQGLNALERVRQRGCPQLVAIDEVPADVLLVTCAEVGAPSAAGAFIQAEDYLRPVQLLQEMTGVKVGGLIACECGANASLLGWYPSICLGIPVVDAPCDGRAHPTGLMGSMSLHVQDGFISFQAAAGGEPQSGKRLEMFVQSGLDSASALVRRASVEAGGMVAVARNPVSCSYVKQHGAPGAIRKCIQVGQVMQKVQAHSGVAVAEAVARLLEGEVASCGKVKNLILTSRDGFDVGTLFVGEYEITFWNEYMTLDLSGQRCATFPDLIMTLDLDNGEPLTSATLREGQAVAVLNVPARSLILGSGVRCSALLTDTEKAIGRPMLPFIDPEILEAP